MLSLFDEVDIIYVNICVVFFSKEINTKSLFCCFVSVLCSGYVEQKDVQKYF